MSRAPSQPSCTKPKCAMSRKFSTSRGALVSTSYGPQLSLRSCASCSAAKAGRRRWMRLARQPHPDQPERLASAMRRGAMRGRRHEAGQRRHDARTARLPQSASRDRGIRAPRLARKAPPVPGTGRAPRCGQRSDQACTAPEPSRQSTRSSPRKVRRERPLLARSPQAPPDARVLFRSSCVLKRKRVAEGNPCRRKAREVAYFLSPPGGLPSTPLT